MKKIGLAIAIETEILEGIFGEIVQTEQVGTFGINTFRYRDAELYMVRCGYGEIAAAAATQLLISVYHVD